MKHKLFSFLLAVVVSVGTMNAEIKNGTCGTNLTWSLNTEDSTLTISGTGVMSNYNISNNPAPWKQDTALIKYLILEDGVTSIGSYAFYDCINLISVTIPNSVESIGNYAFQFCSNLPFVTIPQNVTSIGKQAFRGCSGLKWFACKAVTPPTLGSDVFYGVHRRMPMFVPSASIDNYKNAAWWSEFVNYPSICGSCGDNLMWYLSSDTTVLNIVGTDAMKDYTYSPFVPWYKYRPSILSVSLPDGLTTIGGYAFSGCSALTSITIPNSVTSIGGHAFSGCSALTSITIPNSVTSIGGYAFQGCTGLTSIEIPNSVTSIGNYAFEDCTGLTSPVYNTHVFTYMPTSYSGAYTIPDGIESIAGGAFRDCRGLTSVTIPNSVTSIGGYAFSGCTGLTSVTIPNSVTSIEDYAFDGCTGLTSVTIGNSVTSIGSWAFRGCKGLTSVTIPNSVTSIGYEAFYGCKGLTSVTIGNSVTSIGGSAFSGCTGLTSVTLNSNAIVGKNYTSSSTLKNMFGWQVTEYIIGNSVTSIGAYAFYGCTQLTSVTVLLVIPPTLGIYTFTNVASGCSIFVPCSAVDAYKSAWSSYRSMIKKTPSAYHVTLQADANKGNITVLSDCDEDYTMEAIPLYGYRLTKWSDGNTDNPRVAVIKSDTTFTAEFAIEKSGTCGDNNSLTWLYDDKSQTMTISGNGALTSNYTFGVEAPTQMTTLIIGDGVTAIGDEAFNGMATINHLFIGASVASIGSNAFADCRNFDDITCYATTVPTINATTFENIGNKQYVYLYIPSDRERAYRRDTYWGEFDIQIKSAASTTTDVVKVVPTETTAAVTWPAVSGAATYDLVIKDKSGNAICTLIFNAQGQLTQIAFNAPAQRDALQQTQAAGFSFVITGLEEGNEYNLAIIAKDSNGGQISAENISFTTTTPTAIDQITNGKVSTATKFIRDGKIYILRDGKVYDLTGREL